MAFNLAKQPGVHCLKAEVRKQPHDRDGRRAYEENQFCTDTLEHPLLPGDLAGLVFRIRLVGVTP